MLLAETRLSRLCLGLHDKKDHDTASRTKFRSLSP